MEAKRLTFQIGLLAKKEEFKKFILCPTNMLSVHSVKLSTKSGEHVTLTNENYPSTRTQQNPSSFTVVRK